MRRHWETTPSAAGVDRGRHPGRRVAILRGAGPNASQRRPAGLGADLRVQSDQRGHWARSPLRRSASDRSQDVTGISLHQNVREQITTSVVRMLWRYFLHQFNMDDGLYSESDPDHISCALSSLCALSTVGVGRSQHSEQRLYVEPRAAPRAGGLTHMCVKSTRHAAPSSLTPSLIKRV
jgi:hypothetical protein